MERILAIGDIHGCYGKLAALMEKINFQPERDLLIFVGDYIDRGDYSQEVIAYLLKIKSRAPSTVFLLGNHEEMFLNYVGKNDIRPFLYNGGQRTLNSYFGKNQPVPHTDTGVHFPREHLDFFNSLLPYFETEDYIFVHAGLRSGIPLEEQDRSDLIWIREEFFDSDYNFGKIIIFGHTPFPEPFIDNRKIGIDTGAVYGNKLTCLELPARIFFSI